MNFTVDHSLPNETNLTMDCLHETRQLSQDSNFTEEENRVSVPLEESQTNWPNLMWTFSFTLIVVFGTCGNGIVLWIVLGEFKRLHERNHQKWEKKIFFTCKNKRKNILL